MISVDTKKKELVGQYKNASREWRPKARPVTTRTHDLTVTSQPRHIDVRDAK